MNVSPTQTGTTDRRNFIYTTTLAAAALTAGGCSPNKPVTVNGQSRPGPGIDKLLKEISTIPQEIKLPHKKIEWIAARVYTFQVDLFIQHKTGLFKEEAEEITRVINEQLKSIFPEIEVPAGLNHYQQFASRTNQLLHKHGQMFTMSIPHYNSLPNSNYVDINYATVEQVASRFSIKNIQFDFISKKLPGQVPPEPITFAIKSVLVGNFNWQNPASLDINSDGLANTEFGHAIIINPRSIIATAATYGLTVEQAFRQAEINEKGHRYLDFYYPSSRYNQLEYDLSDNAGKQYSLTWTEISESFSDLCNLKFFERRSAAHLERLAKVGGKHEYRQSKDITEGICRDLLRQTPKFKSLIASATARGDKTLNLDLEGKSIIEFTLAEMQAHPEYRALVDTQFITGYEDFFRQMSKNIDGLFP